MNKSKVEPMRVLENIFFRELEAAVEKMRATQSARLAEYAAAFTIADKTEQTAAVAEVLKRMMQPQVAASDYMLRLLGYREH